MKPDLETQHCAPNASTNKLASNTDSPPARKANPAKIIDSTPAKKLKNPPGKVSRERWIADAAYYKAEARGFDSGHELIDWLAAEQEYIKMLVDLFLVKCQEDGDMTITGLRQLARDVGVPRPERIDSKIKLIRSIQVADHHNPCFRDKLSEFCKIQHECPWSGECQKLIAEWRR